MTYRQLPWEIIKGLIIIAISFYLALEVVDGVSAIAGTTLHPLVHFGILFVGVWIGMAFATKNIRRDIQASKRKDQTAEPDRP